MWELDCEESWTLKNWSLLGVHWKDWCWSWNFNTLATWCEELTHWKRPWCWERLRAGGEGADRGWDGWMASPTQWTWIWVNSESWWWTGRPGMLRFVGLQRVGHYWVSELNWTDSFQSTVLWIHFLYVNAKTIFTICKQKKWFVKRPCYCRNLNVKKMILSCAES